MTILGHERLGKKSTASPLVRFGGQRNEAWAARCLAASQLFPNTNYRAYGMRVTACTSLGLDTAADPLEDARKR